MARLLFPLAFVGCLAALAVAWRFSQFKAEAEPQPEPEPEDRRVAPDRRKAARDWSLGSIRRASDQALH